MEEKGNIPSEYTFGIKLLIILYAFTPFVPRLEAIDPIGSQWLYVGIANMGSLFLAYKLNNAGLYKEALGRHTFLYGFLTFIIVSGLSIFGAINVFEGLKVFARVVTTFIGVVSLYYLFQINAKAFFKWAGKVLIIITFLLAIQVVYHFVSNWTTPRIGSLLKGAELLFGNRNVTSATLSVLLPFSLWGCITLEKRWKLISLVTLFLCVTGIFYIGSRTALLSSSLIILTFIIYGISSGFSDGSLSRKLKTLFLPLILVLITSVTIVLNSNRVDSSRPNSVFNIITTLSSVSELEDQEIKERSTQSSARETYYTMAIQDITSYPLLGIGIGNWKLSNKDLYYENSQVDKYLYPARTHNDFLQIAAETGVLGGFIYMLLFVLLGYLLLKNLFKSRENEVRWIYLILLLSLMAYSIDALLNFPLERTPMQVLWVFIVSLTLASVTRDTKRHESSFLKGNKIKIVSLAIINIGILHVLFSNYKMYVTENYILADTSGKDLLTTSYTYKYPQAKVKLDHLFDITSGGKPVDHYLAMYAMSEGDNDLALNHLDKSIKTAPNHYESRGLKAIIYGQIKKDLDSAIYYASEGFRKYPAIKNNYVILLNAHRELKDTTAYFNTYDAWLAKYPNDVSQWKAKAERLFEFYKDESMVIETIEKGIEQNPNDESLIKFREKYVSKSRSEDIRKWYKNGFSFIKEKDNVNAKNEFLKILEIYPTNSATLLNLGIIEIKMNQYEEAIVHLTTIIEAGSFNDGRAEYNRALAYEKIGNIEMARKDYTRSKKLGYKLAKKLPQNKLE